MRDVRGTDVWHTTIIMLASLQNAVSHWSFTDHKVAQLDLWTDVRQARTNYFLATFLENRTEALLLFDQGVDRGGLAAEVVRDASLVLTL